MQVVPGLTAADTGLILAAYGVTTLAFGGGFLASLMNLFMVFKHPTSWWAKVWALLLTLSFGALVWLAVLAKLMSFSTNY